MPEAEPFALSHFLSHKNTKHNLHSIPAVTETMLGGLDLQKPGHTTTIPAVMFATNLLASYK